MRFRCVLSRPPRRSPGQVGQLPCWAGFYCPGGLSGPIACSRGEHCPAGAVQPQRHARGFVGVEWCLTL